MLERLGQQSAELGELALDPAGAEPDVARAEEHLVLLDDDLEPRALDGRGDADEIGECACGHDGCQVLRRAALEWRRAHRHAVRVGCGHRQHTARELDQDAREDRAGIVAGGGPENALCRLQEGLAIDAEGTAVIDLGEAREVVRVVGVQRVAAGAALERHQAGPVARGELDLLGRQVAHDVEQQPTGHDDPTGLVHVRQELRPHGELHVGRGELDRLLRRGRVDQHARQDLHARALRDPPGYDLEVLEKVVLGAGDPHGARSLDGWAAHTATRTEARSVLLSRSSREKDPVVHSKAVDAVGKRLKHLLRLDFSRVSSGDGHPRRPMRRPRPARRAPTRGAVHTGPPVNPGSGRGEFEAVVSHRGPSSSTTRPTHRHIGTARATGEPDGRELQA